ncbi:MAG: GIY-YIG nuclease family protein, partial [Synergistaceae bacterium]|nr:GIY-YIG nuclease family protein [Synergistaceae bacterium]
MDKNRRRELMEAYKQMKVYMGVYQIKNNENSKVLIGTSSNLKNRWLTLRMQLEAKRHPNAGLQTLSVVLTDHKDKTLWSNKSIPNDETGFKKLVETVIKNTSKKA